MTTAISLVALALSVISLAWQAWTWRNNGPMVRVNVTNAITDAVTGEPGHYVAVEAVNTGRAATTVTGWGFAMPGGANVYPTRALRISEPLPCRLASIHRWGWWQARGDARREVSH